MATFHSSYAGPAARRRQGILPNGGLPCLPIVGGSTGTMSLPADRAENHAVNIQRRNIPSLSKPARHCRQNCIPLTAPCQGHKYRAKMRFTPAQRRTQMLAQWFSAQTRAAQRRDEVERLVQGFRGTALRSFYNIMTTLTQRPPSVYDMPVQKAKIVAAVRLASYLNLSRHLARGDRNRLLMCRGGYLPYICMIQRTRTAFSALAIASS